MGGDGRSSVERWAIPGALWWESFGRVLRPGPLKPRVERKTERGREVSLRRLVLRQCVGRWPYASSRHFKSLCQ
jgi:hypothetical protein